eukprot:scaffold2636_cov340-Pavlova_lutheri.AAC.22
MAVADRPGRPSRRRPLFNRRIVRFERESLVDQRSRLPGPDFRSVRPFSSRFSHPGLPSVPSPIPPGFDRDPSHTVPSNRHHTVVGGAMAMATDAPRFSDEQELVLRRLGAFSNTHLGRFVPTTVLGRKSDAWSDAACEQTKPLQVQMRSWRQSPAFRRWFEELSRPCTIIPPSMHHVEMVWLPWKSSTWTDSTPNKSGNRSNCRTDRWSDVCEGFTSGSRTRTNS